MGLQAFYKKGVMEAGCDEAGRGCLAGPVFAAAVILPASYKNKLLTDSKQLSQKRREELRVLIENEAVAYAVARIEPEKIDEINIFKASILAMHQAVEMLSPVPEHLLIDGKYFNSYKDIPHQCIIKGDGKFLSIAAASVLAKTYRDEYMTKIHDQHPNYNWKKNKGYPTKEHREAIRQYGITTYHRKSFRLLPEAQQLKIENIE